MAERQSSLEVLRLVSAAGIVWFHAAVTGSQIGYIGLTVFLILTPMFELGPNASRITPWTQHARRLLIPFAFWSVIYLLANIVKGKPPINTDHGLLLGILAGPSIHLWYLPFMAMALAATNMLKTSLKPQTIVWSATAVLGPLLALHHTTKDAVVAAGQPLPQWFHALTPLVLGIIFGASCRTRRIDRIPAELILLAAMLWWQDMNVVQFLAGFLLVEAASLIRWSNATVNRLASAMMGVYLVRPLALTVFRPVEPYSQAAFVLGAFGASMIGVMIAARLAPSLSAMLLGTPVPKGQQGLAGQPA